jgi:high-affinity Fe2+/Pb2+ permease
VNFAHLDTAQLIALVAGVVIPFVVAFLSRPTSSPTLRAVLAAVSAGLVALGTWLTDTSGSHTWRGALSVFVVALVSAATSRVTLTEHKVAAVQARDTGIG